MFQKVQLVFFRYEILDNCIGWL